jgi:hypothetical protein
VNAQTTIVEEKFVDGGVPLDYHYFPKSNKFVIEKGQRPAKVSLFLPPSLQIKSVISYDIFGKKEILVENVDWKSFSFSITENTFRGTDFTNKLSFNETYKYFVNGKATSSIKLSNNEMILRNYDNSSIDLANINYTFGSKYYNDKYELEIVNDNGKSKINYEKDDLYLNTVNIFSNEKKTFKIEKPDVNRLMNEECIKPKEYLGFASRLIDNEKFEIITKSISKDYKTSILFRTFYNMEGKKLDEKKYAVSLSSEYLIYSANNAARIGPKPTGFVNETPIFLTDLGINDFLVDNVTLDVYIFGLYGFKGRELNDDNSPAGHYIFKFDKDGNQIWKSINKIDDKDDFNKKIHLARVDCSLSFIKNNLCFQSGVSYSDKYYHYSILDKGTGNILNKDKIVYNRDMFYNLETKQYKNKLFDINGLIAIDSNGKIANYLKNNSSKNKLFFSTVFSDKGIWLFETDKKEYYKLTFFENL